MCFIEWFVQAGVCLECEECFDRKTFFNGQTRRHCHHLPVSLCQRDVSL